MLTLLRYTPDMADVWNEAVAGSRNGTFLFNRQFMDYHAARFADCSLLFQRKGKIAALLPANSMQDGHAVCSHQGLTYGGIVMATGATATDTLDILAQAKAYYRQELGATKLLYKPTPYIYHRYPSEEPLYALFRSGARLVARGLSSCIDLRAPISLPECRRAGLRKAQAAGLRTDTTAGGADTEQFWNILNAVLRQRHGVRPAHSAPEMLLLMERFPAQVRLHVARDRKGDIAAGAWVFDCGPSVHTQYMAASDSGRRDGALDFLITELMTREYAGRAYFDFGVSTEDNGSRLNEGLAFQKEGFGGRGVCYDTWEVDL